jgi:SAM-dependent methyltransferase
MLIVPDELQRNTAGVAKEGYENSGQRLMFLARDRAGLKDFSNTDILDIGCGVRFTVTLLNREIDVKSYTGIENHEPIVDFLSKEVTDPRFHFAYWNVHNSLYNKDGDEMEAFYKLPVDGQYDLVWLFSVFTHQNPSDSLAMFKLIRKHIREDGKLVFTCFINEELETFNDEHGDLIHAHYGEEFFHSMIKNSGWAVDKWFWAEIRKNNPYGRMYVCSPKI